ncbi:MAG: ADP-forming succinate--CoA ligase subunit beta [Armatimonadetes bacterium]|nr:ADP-forming succinate--CoA ligase subunit beta [Armatimonadota bacterium]
MKIHEYQAKQILARYGVPIPRGEAVTDADAAAEVARQLGSPVVVKAQVPVGGRGKAGGVKLARTPDEARAVAGQILGMSIKGIVVRKVLVEEAAQIAAEYYLGITVDRAARRNVVMVSAAGGMEIEEVAATTPEKIARVWIDPGIGLADFQIRQVCYAAGLEREAVASATRFLRALYDAYVANDAGLAEINPLVLTTSGSLIATDAKIDIDDNALYRHPELAAYKEESEDDPVEAEAHRRGLQFVRLEGDVGIIGNGAGLVMSTLDEVKRAGGAPANFLDIGGGAKADLVANALEVVLSNERVKGVLFNIFGGITRCDEVAKGILEAARRLSIRVPIVVRLTGTNEQEGRALLQGTKLIPAETMEQAAARIVALVRGGAA